MRREGGFTLVELIVTVSITGIVMAALAASIIVGLRTTDDTNNRLAESHDAHLLASYFPSDVQSAESISTTTTACGSGSSVISLSWQDQADAKAVSYTVAGSELRRRYCVGGSVASDVAVAHYLVSAPTPACPPPNGACLQTSRTAGLVVTVRAGSAGSDTYSFTVQGTRRVTA